jgi:hypothetical protein
MLKAHFGHCRNEFGVWKSHFGVWKNDFGMWKTHFGRDQTDFGTWKTRFGRDRNEFGSEKNHFSSDHLSQFPAKSRGLPAFSGEISGQFRLPGNAPAIRGEHTPARQQPWRSIRRSAPR